MYKTSSLGYTAVFLAIVKSDIFLKSKLKSYIQPLDINVIHAFGITFYHWKFPLPEQVICPGSNYLTLWSMCRGNMLMFKLTSQTHKSLGFYRMLLKRVFRECALYPRAIASQWRRGVNVFINIICSIFLWYNLHQSQTLEHEPWNFHWFIFLGFMICMILYCLSHSTLSCLCHFFHF